MAHKSLMVKIFVYEGDSDVPIRSYLKDIRTLETKEWLANMVVWACANNYSVEVINYRNYK
jgi:hypothetical protein